METKVLERVCGEFIFLFFAMLICFLIYNTKNYRKIKFYLIIYVIILSILSYLFRPFFAMDLTRLHRDINLYYNYSWSTLFEKMIKTSDYTRLFYFYLIHKMGDVNLLQTFVTTLVYSIVFYTIYDYSKIKKYDGRCVARVVFFFMMLGQYIELIAGIRSTTAFALFYLCIYRELIKNKPILSNVFIYLLAIGFHNAVVPAVLIRIFFILFKKETKWWKYLVNFAFFICIVWLTMKYGFLVLDATSKKANGYLTQNVFSSRNGYLVSLSEFIALIYLFFINYKYYRAAKKKDIQMKNYIKFSIPFFLIIIIFNFEYSIFHRYVFLLSMIIIPIITTAFNNLCIENKEEFRSSFCISTHNLVYLILLFAVMFLSFTMGDMKLLQFF